MTRALPVLAACARLLVLGALLVLPGCLKLRQTFVLAADGSGSVRLEHEFDPTALQALLARVRALVPPGGGGGGVAAPPANPVAPTWLTASAAASKEYVLGIPRAEALDGGRTRVTAEGRFPSLEAAARGEAFHGADVRLERLPKGVWRLTLRDPWTPAGAGSSTVFGGLEQAFVRKHFLADLKTLSRTLRITFPVPVRLTNGTLAPDGRTVTWSAKADAETPHALTAEVVLPPEQPWPTFHHRPDLAALSRRCLLPPPAPPVPPREE